MAQATKKPQQRILHVAFTLHDPMINQWLTRFLRKMKGQDIQIDLITTADEAPLFQDVISDIGGKILVCPHPKNKREFLNFLTDSLNQNNSPAYDVVHVHPFIMAGDILRKAFQAGISTRVVHAHTDRRKARRDKDIFAKIRHHVSTMLVRRLASHGVAPSDSTAQDIFGQNWQSDKRWQIMPYGLDLDRHKPTDQAERKREIKSKLAIPQSAQIIAHIAPFNFEKNHDLTLEVFAREARRNLSLYLILAGQGPLRNKIEEDVIARGLENRVVFLDHQTDDADILTIANLVLRPSLYETDISVLIKAQIYNEPCLISNDIEKSAYLKNDLIHSLSIEAEADVWGKAVRTLLAGEMQAQGNKKESLKGSPFDISTNVSKFLGLYQQFQKS